MPLPQDFPQEGDNLTVYDRNEYNITFVDNNGQKWSFSMEEEPKPDTTATTTTIEQQFEQALAAEEGAECEVPDPLIPLSDIPRHAMRTLVNYLYDEELADYEEEHGEHSADQDILDPDHTFTHVMDLDTFVSEMDEQYGVEPEHQLPPEELEPELEQSEPEETEPQQTEPIAD